MSWDLGQMISGSDIVLGFWLPSSKLQFLWGSVVVSSSLSFRQSMVSHCWFPWPAYTYSSLCLLSLPVHAPAARRIQVKTLREISKRRDLITPSCLFLSQRVPLSRFWNDHVLSSCPSPISSVDIRMWDIQAQSLTPFSVHLLIRQLLRDADGVVASQQAVEIFHFFLFPPLPKASWIFYELKMSRENTPSWSICSWVRERYSLSMKFRLPSEQKARKNSTCGKWD